MSVASLFVVIASSLVMIGNGWGEVLFLRGDKGGRGEQAASTCLVAPQVGHATHWLPGSFTGMPYAQLEFLTDEAVKCRRMAAAATDAASRKRWADFAAEYDRLIEENGGTPPFEEIPR